MPQDVADAFGYRLSARERRLGGRLEGFGDIVFGFAVSQCALQLPTVAGHVELGHVTGVVLYFSTFAVLTTLWLTYHRMMSPDSFRPTRIDLALAFAYLALVSLVPYAMYTISHETRTFESARTAIAEYSTLFGLMMILAVALTVRNLRRAWWMLAADERDRAWLDAVRRAIIALFMAFLAALDLTVGPEVSGLGFFGIFGAMVLVRVFVKHAPSAQALRVPAAPG